MKTRKISLCFLVVHFALFSASAIATQNVPPGFEELVKGQQVWLEVNVLGQSVGLFEATVSLDNVTFKDPNGLLKALNLKTQPGNADYQEILTALSGPLARHGNLACSSNADAQGCGYLETDSVAIIYDENNNRVDLFANKELLPEGDKHALYYTPTRQAENALIHQQTLNVSAQNDYKTLSLQGAGALGVLEDSYLGIDWLLNSFQGDSSSQQTLAVDDFYYRQSLGVRHYLQAGRMDSRDLSSSLGGNISFSLLPLKSIDGMRLGSSLSYLNQVEASKGTPIVVLLSAKSRIDAYRGGLLLGSYYLDNGSNTLDTSNFPGGSYAVTLKIYENNNLVRTETQPFTKTGGISDGHLQWFMQFGETAQDSNVFSNDDDSTIQRKPVAQAGFKMPLPGAFTTTLGVAKTDGNSYAESGLQWTHGFDGSIIDGVLDIQANYFKGTENSKGDVEQISYNDGFSFSLYRNAAHGTSCTQSNSEKQDYADIGCYTSLNATIAVPVKGWTTSLGYTWNTNNSLYSDSSVYDPNRPFEDNLVNNTQSQTTSSTWQLSLNKTFSFKQVLFTTRFGGYSRQSSSSSDNDKGVYVGFSLSRSTPKDSQQRSSSTTVSSNYQSSQTGSGQLSYNAAQNWDWGNNNEREVEINVGGNNTDNATASLSGRMNGKYGDSNVTLSDSYDNEQHNHETSLTGSYSSSLSVSKSGAFWGPAGNGSPGAAVAVNVKGEEEDEDEDDDSEADNNALIDVDVAGGGSAQLNKGSHVLFPVGGFEQGRVSINESQDVSEGSQANITEGAGSQQLFLLPGKLKVQEVKMESKYTFVGQLIDTNNQPIMPDKILNASMFSASEDGGFTAEVNRMLKNLYLIKQGTAYQCSLKILSSQDVVRYVGKTSCSEISLVSLPDDLHALITASLNSSSPSAKTE